MALPPWLRRLIGFLTRTTLRRIISALGVAGVATLSISIYLTYHHASIQQSGPVQQSGQGNINNNQGTIVQVFPPPPSSSQATQTKPAEPAKPTQPVSYSMNLWPSLEPDERPNIPITLAEVCVYNRDSRILNNLSLKINTPPMLMTQIDDRTRMKLIGGGNGNANFTHLLVPQLVPEERQTATLMFIPVKDLSVQGFAKTYHIPPKVFVYRSRSSVEESYDSWLKSNQEFPWKDFPDYRRNFRRRLTIYHTPTDIDRPCYRVSRLWLPSRVITTYPDITIHPLSILTTFWVYHNQGGLTSPPSQ